MTEQPPSTSKEALELVDELREFTYRPHTWTGDFRFDVAGEDAALKIDALCEQRVSARDAKWSPEITAGRANLQECGTAFRMIRDALAELSAAVPPIKERDVGPPSYTKDAEEIIDGLSRAIAAVASEHQAAFERLLAVHAKTLRDRADDKAALLARLQEPEIVDAGAAAAFEAFHTTSKWSEASTKDYWLSNLRAALTKIAEVIE